MLRDLQICLNACLQCLQDCERLLAEGISSPGYEECARICRDCADILQLCTYLMLRKSAIHSRSYAICADICIQGADLCGRFAEDTFQRCASSCRHCAALCIRMAGVAAA